MMIFPIISFGQIEVIEDTPNVVAELTEGRNDVMVLRLTETEIESGVQYFLAYKDGRYDRIYRSQVHFIGNKETLFDLKNQILGLFEDEENEKDLKVEIGGSLAAISKMRIGRRSVVFLMIDGKGHTEPLRERKWREFFEQLDG